MFFVYFIIIVVVLYCIAAIIKSKTDKIGDEEARENLNQLMGIMGNVSIEKKRELLLQQYNILENTVSTLEKLARTTDQFAQIDRIKRNMKIIMQEYNKLKDEI